MFTSDRWHHRMGRTAWVGAALVTVLLAVSSTAVAKPEGQNLACYNCHEHPGAKVTVSANVPTVMPGETVTLTVAVSRTSGNRAGFFLTSYGKGEFQLVDAAGTRTIAGDPNNNTPPGVTHTMPKTATSGNVMFQVRWKAPSQPGSVDFDVWGVSANGVIIPDTGKLSPEDDTWGHGRLGYSFGCDGKAFWTDNDKDGYGNPDLLGPTQSCEKTPELAENDDDCDDNTAATNPKGTETCNQIDDDCDGMTDEGLMQMMLYPDNDGDGFGTSTGAMSMMTGCGNIFGFAVKAGDCDDAKKGINPGAMETCNQVDDDCDGKVDDGATPYCGVGWCRRASPTCDEAQCKPGTPKDETCNGFDDDCDGETDEGKLCPSGQTCKSGKCGSGGTGGEDDDGAADDGNTDDDSSDEDDDDDDGGGSKKSGCAFGGASGAVGPLLFALLGLALIRRRR